MQHSQGAAYMQIEWLLPMFILGWLLASGLLAYVSGWHSLAERFPKTGEIEGERFRFASAAIGIVRWFPVNYSNCLFITVGRRALALSVFFPFRLISPEVHIPWTQVESVEERMFLFMRRVMVRVRDSRVKLTFWGGVGQSVLAAYVAATDRQMRGRP